MRAETWKSGFTPASWERRLADINGACCPLAVAQEGHAEAKTLFLRPRARVLSTM